ncbi:heme/hemin ABC transporter substrate-binding protein [Myroides guanonis]|uniref:Iron complex transport system substrate-binding protein n=1 Tax=Myroides guanonis TaxID=1150112 RepID=A0A1I3TPN0_9FLAO|nr:helical backbone metal receptor [Myroides guanonis]SFJ72570.1 iron complex transport system substrate-binding protein [Myroides guanonis]
MKTSIQILFMVFLLVSCGKNKKQDEQVVQEAEIQQDRIISLNGSITEILAALDYNTQIVGVDVTSSYPESIKNVAKDLGHVNKVSIESIMELKPTLVLGLENEVSEDLKKQLADAGVNVQLITLKHSIEGSKEMIQEVAKAVKNENYTKLLTTIDTEIKDVTVLENKPKVLFIYARGAGMLMVAGTGTPIDEMIKLAGGQNAITEFSDYKPLTPESLLANNPDYILLFDTGLQSVGGIDGVLKIDGIAQTNAGKNKKIIAMDGQLLSGFGPRVGKGVKELNQLLSK